MGEGTEVGSESLGPAGQVGVVKGGCPRGYPIRDPEGWNRGPGLGSFLSHQEAVLSGPGWPLCGRRKQERGGGCGGGNPALPAAGVQRPWWPPLLLGAGDGDPWQPETAIWLSLPPGVWVWAKECAPFPPRSYWLTPSGPGRRGGSPIALGRERTGQHHQGRGARDVGAPCPRGWGGGRQSVWILPHGGGGPRRSASLLSLTGGWHLKPPTCPQGPRGLWAKLPSSHPNGSRGPGLPRPGGRCMQLPPPRGAVVSAPALTLDQRTVRPVPPAARRRAGRRVEWTDRHRTGKQWTGDGQLSVTTVVGTIHGSSRGGAHAQGPRSMEGVGRGLLPAGPIGAGPTGD